MLGQNNEYDQEAMDGAMVDHYQQANPYGEGAHGTDPLPPEKVWSGSARGQGNGAGAMGYGGGQTGAMSDGDPKRMMRDMLYERLRGNQQRSDMYQSRGAQHGKPGGY